MTSQRDQQLERRIINEIPYQVLVEQSLVGIYLIQDGILKYCNTAFAGITGHTPRQKYCHYGGSRKHPPGAQQY